MIAHLLKMQSLNDDDEFFSSVSTAVTSPTLVFTLSFLSLSLSSSLHLYFFPSLSLLSSLCLSHHSPFLFSLSLLVVLHVSSFYYSVKSPVHDKFIQDGRPAALHNTGSP